MDNGFINWKFWSHNKLMSKINIAFFNSLYNWKKKSFNNVFCWCSFFTMNLYFMCKTRSPQYVSSHSTKDPTHCVYMSTQIYHHNVHMFVSTIGVKKENCSHDIRHLLTDLSCFCYVLLYTEHCQKWEYMLTALHRQWMHSWQTKIRNLSYSLSLRS